MTATSETPLYRLTAPFFGPDNVLYDEGAEIEFDGCPNAEMQPLNDSAGDKYEKFIRSLPDGKTPPLEEIVEKAMNARHAIKSEEVQGILDNLRRMIEPNKNATAEVIAPVMRGDVPLMGNDPRARAKMKKNQTSTISQMATPDQYQERLAEATKARLAQRIGS